MVAISGAIMPEPLAMPAIVTSLPPIRACGEAALGKGVGRADRFGRILPRSRAQPVFEGRQRRDQLVDRQRLADHAGRRDVDVLGVAAQQIGDRFRLAPHGGIARRADHDIGRARIDDQPSRGAAWQDLAAPRDRMPGQRGPREQARDRAALGQLEKGQVGSSLIAQRRCMAGKAHAGHRWHRRKAGGRQG